MSTTEPETYHSPHLGDVPKLTKTDARSEQPELVRALSESAIQALARLTRGEWTQLVAILQALEDPGAGGSDADENAAASTDGEGVEGRDEHVSG